MNLLAIIAEAWRAMGQNKLRSGLTMLGMIIGVGAVVVMLGIGQGTRTTVSESIKSMGSNLFIVLSGASTSGGLRMGSGSAPTLTADDAEALAALDSVSGAAPVVSGTVQLAYGPNNWSTFAYGVTPDFLLVRDWVLESGQNFSDVEVRGASRVVLLGKTVSKNLFGEDDPIGKTIRIKGSPYQVIGLLSNRGQSLDGRDQDDSVLIPLTTGQRKLFGGQFPGSVRYILVQAKTPQQMPEAEQEISELLRIRHRLTQTQENDFTVRNLAAVAQTAATSADSMSFMLGAIASISLLVGGIGIMNIMLVSVTERTREIGIRKSLGARRRDIMSQFLVESATLSTVGAALGVATGFAFAKLIAAVTPLPAAVELWSVFLGVGIGAGVGIIAGAYPASRASRLDPITALRAE